MFIKNKKKTSIILAFCMALSMFATACNKKPAEDDSVVTNVITSSNSESISDNGAETQVPQNEPQPDMTITITDDAGNQVTDSNGSAVTIAVTTGPAATTTTAGPTETLSPEASKAIEDALTQKPTEITTVVKPSQIANGDKYAYNTLTEDEKALYDAIVYCSESMIYRLNAQNVDKKTWSKILGLVYFQEPQLFWLNSTILVGKLYFLEYDTNEIARMQKEIDATVAKIMKDADAKTTTFDKLKVFHDYIVKNSNFEKSTEDGAYNSSIYSVLSGKVGNVQCSGYAKAMKYLCDQAGINCMVITGNNKDGSSHAWNIVDVDGAWYNIDVTWDDPKLPTPDSNYLRHTFFLVPDKWIKDISHFNANVKDFAFGTVKYFTPPSCTESSQNYFAKKNMIYSDAASAEAAIKSQIDSVLASNGKVIEIRCENKEVYNAVYKKLKDYQTYAREKSSKVKGLSDMCTEAMLIIELDVQYN